MEASLECVGAGLGPVDRLVLLGWEIEVGADG